VLALLEEFIEDEDDPDTWDVEKLHQQLFTVFPLPADITPDSMRRLTLEELEETLIKAFTRAYDDKTTELGEELMRRAERLVMLNTLDQFWRRHLTDLDMLREGIGLVALAQRDPLVEYQREAFTMWEGMQREVREKAAHDLLHIKVQTAQQQPVHRSVRAFRPGDGAGSAASRPETVRKSAKDKIGRNEPCHCGSGKKYKNCHMRQDQRDKLGAN
jgi:preprotein translocase subunit SecA